MSFSLLVAVRMSIYGSHRHTTYPYRGKRDDSVPSAIPAPRRPGEVCRRSQIIELMTKSWVKVRGLRTPLANGGLSKKPM